MDRVMRSWSRLSWVSLARLRERLTQLGHPVGREGTPAQTRYLARLIGREARDPRELLRRYANDSML